MNLLGLLPGRKIFFGALSLIIVVKNQNCQAYLLCVLCFSVLSVVLSIFSDIYIAFQSAAISSLTSECIAILFFNSLISVCELLQWGECGATAERTSERGREKRFYDNLSDMNFHISQNP